MGHTWLCLRVFFYRPKPVLTVSPSWPSPGASVTLNCSVDHPSAGWSFYWYKAVPKLSYSYSYELLPGSENGTEQHLFIIDGQTHTAGYVCRAGRGDPVYYSWHSKPKFVWSGDLNSAASLTVSPDSVQHFTNTSVSLSCEGNSTEWRVRRFMKSDILLHCSFWGTMTGSTCTITSSWVSGVFWCESETGQFSNAVNITIDERPEPVLTVSPSWPSPGASVTLNCSVDHPSDGWSFYWYKAVTQKSDHSYSSYGYELLPGSENGTEQHLFIIDGQTHTAGYVCRAGRGDPVYYSWHSKPKFVWSGELNSAASLRVSPDSVQHFTKTSVSLSCEGNSTEWRVMTFSKPDYLLPCSSWGTMTGSTCTITSSWASGVFWCESETGQFSNAVNITKYDRPEAVLTVSPSWPSPGASVTLNCRLDHPSAGWSFYWYKAVPQKSDHSYNSYGYELLPGSENGTEQHLFIIDGQTHTAGYVCRAGREDPVYYSWSEPKFVWSGDLNSAASLTVSPDSVQHFPTTSVSLSCEGNSTEWRVRTFTKSYLYPCSSSGKMTGSTCTITSSWVSGVFWCESETGQFSNAVNITIDDDEMILVSPVRPVAEGRSVTLSCKFKTGSVLYNVDFYKDDKLIQNDTRKELNISAVSKSDEGFYKCKQRDSADGRTSPESWFSVKSASRPGKASQFPILLIVGLLGGVVLIILLLLFLHLYRKSKDSCCIRSQSTNQGPGTDHMIKQDEIQNMPQYSTLLHGDRCLYETIGGPVEAGNGASNEPEESLYSNVAADQ
ncbi:uncharacterized protein LOC117485224 isoform X2 [Trematomus bernacchii]|uniref:uncharacterized protein LOC117485224 isoform X2 n=1 Tax=Trematomus bernacchii TaxID=40690 RepID=UPI00146B46E4|nr:uncharacterized protein LOC117485224 isoform X2 [Trematomus bernacchii]